MSTLVPSRPAPRPRLGLLDFPVELVEQIISDMVSDLPFVSLVAFSLTSRAARHLCTPYLHNLDWTAFRRTRWGKPCHRRVRGAITEDNCRQLLQLLARDLTASYVYCHGCVKLHPFYDTATELSPEFRLPEYRYLGRLGRCEFLDTRARWLFDTGFFVSRRQIQLIEHYCQHGHGIPAHLFNRAIEAAVPLPAAGAVPAAPRWRRRIWFYHRETKNRPNLFLAVRHELVAPTDDAEARKRARRYLESTPYWVCPHLRTHALEEEDDESNNHGGHIRYSVGCSLQEPGVLRSWRSGLHDDHKGARLHEVRQGDWRDPLGRARRRVPGLDFYGNGTAAAADYLVPVACAGERLGVWIHCLFCRVGTCWKMESELSALVADGDGGGADGPAGGGGGRDGDAQGGEGMVCLSLTTNLVVC
ncbi:hypothetical protein PG985_016219 [Apiospora marii]|uniref:uncharacterized protein n=1 Tax=Apiospora marii TaxID=335849 RepID=UPI00312DA0D6